MRFVPHSPKYVLPQRTIFQEGTKNDKQEHILFIVTEARYTYNIHTYCITYILYAHTVVVYQYYFHKKNHTATLIV